MARISVRSKFKVSRQRQHRCDGSDPDQQRPLTVCFPTDKLLSRLLGWQHGRGSDSGSGGCGTPFGPVSYTHLDVYKRQVVSYQTRCGSTYSPNTSGTTECLAGGVFGNRSIRRFATSCSTMLGRKLGRRELHQRSAAIDKDRVTDDEE